MANQLANHYLLIYILTWNYTSVPAASATSSSGSYITGHWTWTYLLQTPHLTSDVSLVQAFTTLWSRGRPFWRSTNHHIHPTNPHPPSPWETDFKLLSGAMAITVGGLANATGATHAPLATTKCNPRAFSSFSQAVIFAS